MLGSGGDCCYSNNTLSQGTFYEGAIVSGYPSDTTDSAIQANIVMRRLRQVAVRRQCSSREIRISTSASFSYSSIVCSFRCGQSS